jgi:SNW domain-containing protein 1
MGMASTGGGAGAGDITYDERLFNQDAGMDSGFTADDRYNIYLGRLFVVQPAALSMLYKPNKHDDSDVYGGADEHIEKRTRTGRFRPDKGFSGTPELPVGKRDKPVEFNMREECGEADDPFVELDHYMAKVKEGKKH